MTTPALGVEEFQYTDSGVVLNNDDLSTTLADISNILGLDAPDVRSALKEREGTHGGYVDAEFENMRTVTLGGTLYTSTNAMEAYLDSLKANYAPSRVALPLYFGTDDGVRAVFGKSLGFKYDKTVLRRLGSADFQVQVICEDPRIYDPTVVTEEVYPSESASAGRGYDKGYSYGYGGATGSSNSLQLILYGNREQPGIIRVYGPATNPQVINDDNGTIMNFAIVLADGDYLEINLNNKTVKLNGTTGRRNALTLEGNWYLFNVGANNLRLNATGIDGGVTKLYAQAYRAAWR